MPALRALDDGGPVAVRHLRQHPQLPLVRRPHQLLDHKGGVHVAHHLLLHYLVSFIYFEQKKMHEIHLGRHKMIYRSPTPRRRR
jgi:hypothetical protein